LNDSEEYRQRLDEIRSFAVTSQENNGKNQ
jgi:hypothetical protein